MLKHKQLYFFVSIIVVLLIVIPSPILFLRLSPSEGLLKVLEEGSVQLLGFGGITLGIIYPPRRNLVRRLRQARIRWGERFSEFNADPEEYVKKGMKSEYILARIRDLNFQIDDERGVWMFTLSMFIFSFSLFAADLLLLINHLAEYQVVSNSMIGVLPVGPFFSWLEVAFFMEGVALILIGFIQGATIPEGPVTSERILSSEQAKLAE